MPKLKANSSTLKKVLGRIARYRLNAVLSILLSAVYVGLSLYVPILAGRAIDNIIAPGSVDYAQIMLELTKIAIVAAIAALAQWLMNIINNSMTYNVVKDMRTEAFNRLMKLPLSYIDAHPYGETVSRIIADVDQFADGLLLGFSQIFTGILTIIGTLIFMLSVNAPITLAVVILTPLSLFVARFIARRTHSMFARQGEDRAEQTAFVEEMIGNQKVVQAFAHEQANEELLPVQHRRRDRRPAPRLAGRLRRSRDQCRSLYPYLDRNRRCDRRHPHAGGRGAHLLYSGPGGVPPRLADRAQMQGVGHGLRTRLVPARSAQFHGMNRLRPPARPEQTNGNRKLWIKEPK